MDELDFELAMLDIDDYYFPILEDSEDLDITEFCLELEANEIIDDDQFNYMEV